MHYLPGVGISLAARVDGLIKFIIFKQVCGEAAPCLEDRPKLIYIDAILYETMRITNLFPILSEHSPLKVGVVLKCLYL